MVCSPSVSQYVTSAKGVLVVSQGAETSVERLLTVFCVLCKVARGGSRKAGAIEGDLLWKVSAMGVGCVVLQAR